VLLQLELLPALRQSSGTQVCLVPQLDETVPFFSGLGELRLGLLMCRVLARQCSLAGNDLPMQARFALTEQADLPAPVLQGTTVGQLADMRGEQALLFFAGPAAKRLVRSDGLCLGLLCRL